MAVLMNEAPEWSRQQLGFARPGPPHPTCSCAPSAVSEGSKPRLHKDSSRRGVQLGGAVHTGGCAAVHTGGCAAAWPQAPPPCASGWQLRLQWSCFCAEAAAPAAAGAVDAANTAVWLWLVLLGTDVGSEGQEDVGWGCTEDIEGEGVCRGWTGRGGEAQGERGAAEAVSLASTVQHAGGRACSSGAVSSLEAVLLATAAVPAMEVTASSKTSSCK
eukprot:1159568-Pelagomonas_calceolata.AAC.10